MDLFISGVSYGTSADQIQDFFNDYGEVNEVKIIKKSDKGKNRNYVLVDMPDEQEAENAIRELDGRSLDGRIMSVKKVRSKSHKRNLI